MGLVLGLTLGIAGCGLGAGPDSVHGGAEASIVRTEAVQEAEAWIDDNQDPLTTVLHLESLHRSCRTAGSTTVRCVWARTSPVHDHFGWPQDFVTREFAVDGTTVVPLAPTVDQPAIDEGLLPRYLEGWMTWLAEWYPDLAPSVTAGPTLYAGADPAALRLAYWEYMAFTGVISLKGLPGTPATTEG